MLRAIHLDCALACLVPAAPARAMGERDKLAIAQIQLAGDAALPTFDDADVARLRRALQTGGFLVIDGADPRPGGDFDRSVRALVARLFPREPLHKISPDHVVYKSF